MAGRVDHAEKFLLTVSHSGCGVFSILGFQQYTLCFPFWLWESPVSPVNGGVVGEVWWGRKLSTFAVSALWVICAWRCCVPPRPVAIRVLN